MDKKTTYPMLFFESVRFTAAKFVTDRNWEKFHLPTSLCLALAGECGEVCEIYQWKGDLEQELASTGTAISLSDEEVIHSGEEIADVFIYTTRLCDLCCLDFGKAVNEVAHQLPFDQQNNIFSQTSTWQDIPFQSIESICIMNHLSKYRSQRHISLELQSHVGRVSGLFAKYPEVQTVSLSGWDNQDLLDLRWSIGSIGLLLTCLALLNKLHLGMVIARKFQKNNAKYPVELVQGSSAKYTAYVNQQNRKAETSKDRLAMILIATLASLLSFGLGAMANRYYR